MICLGYEWEIGPDEEGVERDILVFNLAPIEKYQDITIAEEPDTESSLEDLRKKAHAESVDRPKTRQEQARDVYIRSKAIRDYALKRAGSICESCNDNAPFITTQNRPYLEVHHIKSLTDSGPDHPEWVASLCPNCHKEAHYSKSKKQFNEILLKRIKQKEASLVNKK